MRRTSLLLLFGGLAAFSIPSLVAQAPQDAVHAPGGGTRMVIQSIVVPPLTNAPFTATVSTTWVRRLDDGSTETIQNHRTIARDNQGRIYQQRRRLYPEGDPRENEIRQIEISDPQTHEIFYCYPSGHTCELRGYYAPTSPAPVIPAGPLDEGKAFLTRAPLGNDSVSGVETVGTRETTTLNAGAIGTDRSISIVKEFWYSPQLGINLIRGHDSPSPHTHATRSDEARMCLCEASRRHKRRLADFSATKVRNQRGRVPHQSAGILRLQKLRPAGPLDCSVRSALSRRAAT